MGSHSAERPKWFDDDKPKATDTVPLVQMFGTPPMPEYQPQGHTGMDYPAPTRRKAKASLPKKRLITEQMLAIMFGAAIGFFIAGIVYIQMYQATIEESFRQAALVFTGVGMVCSGIVAIAIASVHIYRVRKDQ